MKTDKPIRIIGIDPGTRYTGIGIIDRHGNGLKYVHSETIATVHANDLDSKLAIIFKRLNELLTQFNPDSASVEKIFHSVNARSSLLLGHARGVAILAMALADLEINEYSPNEVKSAVTGVGKASKEQVSFMVQILLNLDRAKKMREDESDALAIAVCHANTKKFIS